VVDKERLTPRLVSILFGGEALRGFPQPVPTAHIKLFLPDADGRLHAPVAGPDGLEWPDGRPTMRTYTPRRYDADANTLEVWFVLHGEGPASAWAERAAPGDMVAIGGPGGRFTLDPAASPWWIAGDESALPAIATLIEALPETATARVHLEVDAPVDLVTLPEHPGIELLWHCRADAPAGTRPGDLLVRALQDDDVSPAAYLWAGCEASAVRRIRSHALDVRSLPRDHVTTRGYWRVGEANHPDHDFGED